MWLHTKDLGLFDMTHKLFKYFNLEPTDWTCEIEFTRGGCQKYAQGKDKDF